LAPRGAEHKPMGGEGNERWFSELCFCILTANSTAKLGMKIQKELGGGGFHSLPFPALAKKLKEAGHRFYSQRARFIVAARKHLRIKEILLEMENPAEMREWLAANILGIGFKEASHFLRNVGFLDFAILDRHILSLMRENGLIEWEGGALTRRRYLEYEKRLSSIAEKIKMPLGELDLFLWYLKTGEVLK
ncbi:MAG: N-glycosylase/DNA lyase, partial [Candidatus Hadarchaeales archaeon]